MNKAARASAAFSSLVIPVILGACSPGVQGKPPAPPVPGDPIAINAAAGARPVVVRGLADGSFIVAGNTATVEAWAMKVDRSGHIVWRYARPYSPAEVALYRRYAAWFSPSLQYNGVAPMPDGSLYLCGAMGRSRDERSPALLTHLAKDGTFLDEQLIYPAGDERPNIHVITGCMAWRGGLIATGGDLGRGVNTFWVFSMGADGKRRWETVFPPLPPQPSEGDTSLPGYLRHSWGLQPFSAFAAMDATADGQAVVIAATDNSHSEVLTVGDEGRLLSRRTFADRVVLMPAVGAATGQRLYVQGWGRTATHAILALDRNLKTLKSRDLPRDKFCQVTAGYALADGSDVLVGGPVCNGDDLAIAHVDGPRISTVPIAPDNPGFFQYWEAMPLGYSSADDRFLAVFSRTRKGGQATPTGPESGLAAVFVWLK